MSEGDRQEFCSSPKKQLKNTYPGLFASVSGEDDDYGLIKIPSGWKENNAESGEPLEPALMTQSQRVFHTS